LLSIEDRRKAMRRGIRVDFSRSLRERIARVVERGAWNAAPTTLWQDARRLFHER